MDAHLKSLLEQHVWIPVEEPPQGTPEHLKTPVWPKSTSASVTLPFISLSDSEIEEWSSSHAHELQRVQLHYQEWLRQWKEEPELDLQKVEEAWLKWSGALGQLPAPMWGLPVIEEQLDSIDGLLCQGLENSSPKTREGRHRWSFVCTCSFSLMAFDKDEVLNNGLFIRAWGKRVLPFWPWEIEDVLFEPNEAEPQVMSLCSYRLQNCLKQLDSEEWGALAETGTLMRAILRFPGLPSKRVAWHLLAAFMDQLTPEQRQKHIESIQNVMSSYSWSVSTRLPAEYATHRPETSLARLIQDLQRQHLDVFKNDQEPFSRACVDWDDAWVVDRGFGWSAWHWNHMVKDEFWQKSWWDDLHEFGLIAHASRLYKCLDPNVPWWSRMWAVPECRVRVMEEIKTVFNRPPEQLSSPFVLTAKLATDILNLWNKIPEDDFQKMVHAFMDDHDQDRQGAPSHHQWSWLLHWVSETRRYYELDFGEEETRQWMDRCWRALESHPRGLEWMHRPIGLDGKHWADPSTEEPCMPLHEKWLDQVSVNTKIQAYERELEKGWGQDSSNPLSLPRRRL